MKVGQEKVVTKFKEVVKVDQETVNEVKLLKVNKTVMNTIKSGEHSEYCYCGSPKSEYEGGK